jgi:hypothetical protein
MMAYHKYKHPKHDSKVNNMSPILYRTANEPATSTTGLYSTFWKADYEEKNRVPIGNVDEEMKEGFKRCLRHVCMLWVRMYSRGTLLLLDKMVDGEKLPRIGSEWALEKQATLQRLAAGEIAQQEYNDLKSRDEALHELFAKVCSAKAVWYVGEHFIEELNELSRNDVAVSRRGEIPDLINIGVVPWLESHGKEDIYQLRSVGAPWLAFEFLQKFETSDLSDCKDLGHEPGQKTIRCLTCVIHTILDSWKDQREVV